MKKIIRSNTVNRKTPVRGEIFLRINDPRAGHLDGRMLYIQDVCSEPIENQTSRAYISTANIKLDIHQTFVIPLQNNDLSFVIGPEDLDYNNPLEDFRRRKDHAKSNNPSFRNFTDAKACGSQLKPASSVKNDPNVEKMLEIYQKMDNKTTK